MHWRDFDARDFWRAIILYGLNTATYKIALGQCLYGFVSRGKTSVTYRQLAESFFDVYLERLMNGRPQLSIPHRQTVMEHIVALHNIGRLDREEAVSKVEKNAFVDVVPRFHVVNGSDIPLKFFEHTSEGLTLTENLFGLFAQSGANVNALVDEIQARWGLLEAAFTIKRENNDLINDIRRFYLDNGYDRTNITSTIPVLNGYQNGTCFYCGEQLPEIEGEVHVDHLIPRQLVCHDEIWNLVLAHRFCNLQKEDAVPGYDYVRKLIERNEHFINSNHPIKEKLIKSMGATESERRDFVLRVYGDARSVIGYTWEGIRGYDPQTDPFYKTFVRNLFAR